jgi:GMP synthase (glutamine-hydrolysing)
MDSPGALAAHLHFADRAVYDVAERAWLKQFIEGWLKRMPRSIMSEAAE